MAEVSNRDSEDQKQQSIQALMDSVNHPQHYGGDTTYEAIKVIEAWGLDFCLGNALKYISRAGHKPGTQRTEDLQKSIWYLLYEINGYKDNRDALIGDLEFEVATLARRCDELEAQLLHQDA